LDRGVSDTQNVEIFMAAAATEDMCTAGLLLLRGKRVEFFLTEFSLESLGCQFSPFSRRSERWVRGVSANVVHN
jgi:hypothetical protein